jgi:hypothetical protein
MKTNLNKAATANTQCQKCLKFGHWTFECTGAKAYLYRPSSMSMLKNPALAIKPVFEAGPETKIHDGDFKRGERPKDDDSSSSSLDSEEEEIHRELEKLIKESKKLTEKQESDSSSDRRSRSRTPPRKRVSSSSSNSSRRHHRKR